jgi:hypothetical protein
MLKRPDLATILHYIMHCGTHERMNRERHKVNTAMKLMWTTYSYRIITRPSIQQFHWEIRTWHRDKWVMLSCKGGEVWIGESCYHSVQNLLSSHLLCKNVEIRIDKTISLPLVLYGCKIWSLTLREYIDGGCLRTVCWGEYLGRRDMEWRVVEENCIMRSFISCTLRQV